MKRSSRGPKRVAGEKTIKERPQKGRVVYERERGPAAWVTPLREATYARLTARELSEAEVPLPAARAPRPSLFKSRFHPAAGEQALAAPVGSIWEQRLSEYHRRRTVVVPRARIAMPTDPIILGQPHWSPLGPSVVTDGQAVGLPAMGGRVPGLAVARGGKLVYAASANGGVFRTEDGGQSWRALMDTFDVNPTNFASTSLACGAIALDLNDPRRVYVGTGEGDTYAMFSMRLTNALPAYRGIGPIRSDDGGSSWIRESTAPGSPPLGGEAFFALAVDPANREHVIAATSKGLYERTITAASTPVWTLRVPGVHSSVVVTTAGAQTHFFAALWGRGVFESTDGVHWAAIGAGFPAANVGRIAIGAQPTNADLLYAAVADGNGGLLGLYRFDRPGGQWKAVKTPPKLFPAQGQQGDYDLAISVDPADASYVYLGGSFYEDGVYWPGSIWRAKVTSSASSYTAASTSIGTRAHADVHVLVHTPGDPNQLWAGCDGGVFFNAAPRTGDNFASRNNGLACLCSNFFAQDPNDPSTLFCGLQDNGTARRHGGSLWKHVNSGDGGYCLINWAKPAQVLCFANGSVYRAEDGGVGDGSWTRRDFAWGMMTEPIVGTPYNPAKPAEANLAALGAGKELYVSADFGATWPSSPTLVIPTQGGIFALAFATPKRLFIGTSVGEVFRADKSGSAWKLTRLDNVAAGHLPLRGLVSDLAVDWSDATRGSVYLSFGGMGDYRHVWRFNGTAWSAASGPAGGACLLDVEHNALAVDRDAPTNVYVGADIGVWHSPDSGQTWQPLSAGLPDAPVFDLQIHPTRRLLRAATHGRGLFEFPL